jgi:inner membrane protein
LDPLTHFLTGAVISRSGLNRKTALATVTMVLAAEIPDADIITNIVGPVEGFAHHRGFTHTFLGAPFMAAAVVGLVYGVHYLQERRRAGAAARVEAARVVQSASGGDPAGNGSGLVRERATAVIDDHIPIEIPQLPIRWGLLYGYALLAVLSHILLDFTNSYGVRPFAPFNWHWYGWDIVSIIEPMITLPLLLALIGPWFFGLIGGEVGAKRDRFPGRKSAIAAMVFIVLVWWVRDYNHRRAVTLLQAEVYSGEEPKRVMAGPYALNPFKWMGVVETANFYENLNVDTLKDELDPEHRAVVRYKPPETPFTLAAKKSPMGRVYLDWARFPHTETELLDEKEGGGAIVHLRDLRYAYPDTRISLLSVSIEVDKKLRVVNQRMGDRDEKCKSPGCVPLD